MIDIIFVICLILIIPAIFLSVYLDYRKSERELLEQKKENMQWLEEELTNPKFSVKFIITDGTLLSSCASVPYAEDDFKFTSEQMAERKLKNYYKIGFFMDQKGNTYPVCNIKQAYIGEY